MASSTPTPKPLAFMETLSPIVSFYQPPPTAPTPTTTPTSSPKLILFASWTGAQDMHIAKYLARYRTLYPSSPIILIKSPPHLLTLKPHTLPSAVSPAVPIIHSLFPPGTTTTTTTAKPELLVHILSNGGSSSLASLYTALSPATLPPHITFIDSAPSEIGLHTSAQFFMAFAPRAGLLRALYVPLAYLLAGVLVGGVKAGVLVEWIKVWGDMHNDREGGNRGEVRRTYVYSEEDRLVDYRCVERHAAAARELGFEVRMERFVGTAHVLHARGEGEGRYWGLVKETWEGAQR
ncbi:hypothetical protein B0T18DRAFT_413420 [Schizothecium vesticola]|uniref:Indole-diterpene biosynthesis protein PaxU n=1 Tax=Schizothecium vesticola TaxID=314040 RepID=A0AA40ENP1_9PEZI|nr:hypothetical protein B0T18DRAFT_413420 [Schizothecium vesticola]